METPAHLSDPTVAEFAPGTVPPVRSTWLATSLAVSLTREIKSIPRFCDSDTV